MSGSSFLGIRTVAVFMVGALVGAFAMVEFVPSASLVGADGTQSFQEGPTASGPNDPGSSTAGPASGSTTIPGPAGPASNPGGGPRDGFGPGEAPPSDQAPGDTPADGAPGDTPANLPRGEAPDCSAGRNAGATDQGVTANEIQMATTVVQSGIGAEFLGETRYAMEAVRNRVNQAGGICGRLLQISYRDDAWSAQDGAQFLRNFIADGIFAVPVGPSSEGLNAVIEAGDFDAAQIPVVGTNGLSLQQYTKTDGTPQPWVFPVAAATVSSARIMAKDAYDRMVQAGDDPGAEDFSIVFASTYKFGVEAAEAFNDEVRRLTGGNINGYHEAKNKCDQSFCALSSGQRSYSTQVNTFDAGQFVALFLEPATALAWMGDSNAIPAHDRGRVKYGFAAAQPLFTEDFSKRCGRQCDTMEVWTGFKPNWEGYRSDPAVQEFVNELRNTNPNADVSNQFTMGAYLGMELLVEALEAVGSNLTRVRLKQELDRMRFDAPLSLTNPMQFTSDNRYVATTMEAWEIQANGPFSGWKNTRIVNDPKFGG